MRLLILNGKRMPSDLVNPFYRGTYRAHPHYHERLPDSHPANRAFYWFLEEGGELGVVSSLARTFELVRAYRTLVPPEELDVMEVANPGQSPEVGTSFLGFDLSNGLNDSLLWWGLRFDHTGTNSPEDKLLLRLDPLINLVQTFFAPRLNGNGLFDEQATAQWCLDCMMGLQHFYPHLFVCSDPGGFEVVGLHLVPEPTGRA